MFGFIKNLFRKKKVEYVYFYVLTSEVYGSKANVRMMLNESLQQDLKKVGKEIVDYDIHTDKQYFESVLIFSTDYLNRVFFKPLLLEIYAFMKKNKDTSVFSYKYTELKYKFFTTQELERHIIVYKFKVNAG